MYNINILWYFFVFVTLYFSQPAAQRAGRDILFDIDVQGAAQLHLSLPSAHFVFILPPSMEELERRLRGRGTDTDEVIRVRLADARQEIREARWFDSLILNDDLDRAYQDLRAAYLQATLAPKLHTALLDSLLF